MSEVLIQLSYPECARINLAKPSQLSFWTQELCVSESQLRQAVLFAGPILKQVRAFLATAGASPYEEALQTYRLMVRDALAACISDLELLGSAGMARFADQFRKAFEEELAVKARELTSVYAGRIHSNEAWEKDLKAIADRGSEQLRLRQQVG